MAADVVGIRNQLLQVVVIGALVVFAHLTACAFPLAVVGIQHRGRTGFVQVERTVDGNLQTFDGRDVNESVGRQGVAFGVAGVQLVVHDGVGIADERTGQAGILAATIVHHVEAIGILHDAAVCVAHIEGIDGGNLRGECPYVTRRRTATVVGQRVVVEAGVRHVAAYLHPRLHLVVGLQAGGQTLHVRLLRDTFVAQVAQRNIVRTFIAGSVDREVVFLTQASARTQVFPVVRHQQVVHAVIVDDVAQRSVGVQLAVLSDEELAFGYIIYHVAQTTVTGRTGNVVVGHDPGLLRGHAHGVGIIVCHGLVVLFVVLAGVGDDVIVLQSARVGTPFGI